MRSGDPMPRQPTSTSKRRSSRPARTREPRQIEREIHGVLAAASDEGDDVAMAHVTRERVREPLVEESVVYREPVQIVLLSAIGPESWDLVATTGRNYGGARAGRILIVLPGGDLRDPLAGIAYAVEYGRPYVHHVWVDEEARGHGLSRVLFDAYRTQVSPRLVIAGPFTKAGRAAAERAGAILEE